MKKNAFLLFSIILLACSKQENINTGITVATTSKSLYKGDQFQIKAISDLDILFESEDEFHATVTDNGLVTAGYVGNTTILISNEIYNIQHSIKVNPRYTLYPDPLLDFKLTKEEFITLLGAPNEYSENFIKYNNYSDASNFISYTFNKENKLEYVRVLVNKNNYEDLVLDFLNERYVLQGTVAYEELGSGTLYCNNFKKSTATLSVFVYNFDATNYAVLYFPTSKTASALKLLSK
ncbi:hypothetical protein QVZ41_07185 [Wenyingzhuangia sp. chi5]|uniref:BIG2 domain-containing protein n=1 Tax=Wenyingzhuangia gilva TaxID=3057677 RepID=A0ABT8VRN4_9FLAO|nr:hypothetical protein [Wenyingzhuangia sp. chi5]MDO3694627.1 hypothetical protein [Wenyingzhuangia sp. chi5]